ncbi:phosphatidate cytidylyltransferase [Chloroflexota bacterium]
MEYNTMLKQRVITVLWVLPISTAVVWFGEPWFTIVVALWGLLAAFEFYRIVAAKKIPPLTLFGLIWTLLFILSPHHDIIIPQIDHALLMSLLLTSAVVLSLIWLLRHPQREGAFTGWAWTMAGIFYVGWLLSYLVALRGLDAGRDWVFFALFTTFASDTTAFFTGRAWGKHRLAPSVSPDKTWEGAVAGVLGAIIISLALVRLFGLPLNYWQATFLGLTVSIFGQLGDLTESLFKRNMGVKESGKLLPGHGGFLDRVDSIVFAGVVVYYYVLSFNAGWLNWL